MLNIIIEFLNKYANLLLVGVTAVYAYLTYRMVKIAKTQVVADIKVSSIVVKSCFNRGKISGKDKIFIEEIKEKENLDDEYFRFIVLFDIVNKSSGNGSINVPSLVIKFSGSNFEYEIHPITKRIESINTGNNFWSDEEITLDKTIYLRGGEYKKPEVDYVISRRQKDSKYFKEFIRHIREDSGGFKYYIKFKDNLGKGNFLKAQKIRSDYD